MIKRWRARASEFAVQFSSPAEKGLQHSMPLRNGMQKPQDAHAQLLPKASNSCELSPSVVVSKASPTHPLLPELNIIFGASRNVALFEIEDNRNVTVPAIHHQSED